MAEDLFNEEEARKVMAWIKGEDDGVHRSGGFPQSGSQWFIISMKWLKKWKILTGLEQGVLEDDTLGPIDNSDIILTGSVWKLKSDTFVKLGLTLGIDYEILPPKAWDYLKNKFNVKEDSEIIRESIDITLYETQVEITYKPLNIVIVNGSDLTTDKPVVIYSSRNATIKTIKKYIRKIVHEKTGEKPEENFVRLWKLEHTIDQVKEKLRKSPPEMPGTLLAKESRNLSEAEIAEQDIVLVEIRNDNDNWVFKTPETAAKVKCEYCKKTIYAGYIKCPCGQYNYCDRRCMDDDSRYHNCRNRFNSNNIYSSSSSSKTYDPAPKTFQRNEYSKLGLCGLQNLGNTCFMNSGLQCVSNTFALTDYFLSDRYKGDLNTTNPLGTRGELAEEYALLLKEMWYGTSSYVSPWRYKKALSRFAPQFSGYNQQDSQEMLSFLLDGLHEDLNRVKNKPYVEEVKVEGLSDEDAAQRFWEAHLMRNQSEVIDLMHGQYRSQVTCPDCNNDSLTFDPFLMLTLPIPTKEQVAIDIFYVPYECTDSIKKVKILVNRKYALKDMKTELSRVVNVDSNFLHFAHVSGQSLEKELVDDVGKESNAWLFAYEYPPLAQDESVIIIEFSRESSYSTYNPSVFVGYPRILAVQNSSSLEEIHLRVYEYTQKALGNPISDIDLLRSKFSSAFPSVFGNAPEDYYKLKLINPLRPRSYYYSSQSKPCPYCAAIKCSNCNLPYTEEPISDYLSKCPTSLFKLEVFFPKTCSQQTLLKLNTTEIHNSYNDAIKLHQSQKEARVSIDDCINLFRSPEQLDENNTSWCSKCKQHVRGYKKMDVYKLPRVLIIHLKRFKQSGYFSTKNNKCIVFPLENFDMGQYALGGQGIYDLYAVSNHYGSLGGGHYTAYAKNHHNGNWYHFDDSSVSQVRNPEESIIGSAAYVLFYKRRD